MVDVTQLRDGEPREPVGLPAELSELLASPELSGFFRFLLDSRLCRCECAGVRVCRCACAGVRVQVCVYDMYRILHEISATLQVIRIIIHN